MKRWFAMSGALLAGGLAVLGAALPGAAARAAVAQPRSQLRNAICHNAINPQNRSISVTAVMRPVAGTQKLQLKFDFLSGTPGSASQTSVHAGNLGKWLTPRNPTLGQLPDDVWNFRKSVFQPDAPAAYRFRVSFRWLGSDGHVLANAVRYTKRCRQRELRPDLMVVAPIQIGPVAGDPSQEYYTAVIANGGHSAAGPFVVEFNPNDNETPQTQTIQRLNASAQLTLTFRGPPCDASNPPEFFADSAAQVNDDLNPSNNSLFAVCPGTTSG